MGEGRLAIRAARIVSEVDFPRGAVGEQQTPEEFSQNREKRGSFEGAIRISLHALSFLFNSFAFRRIPRKSLRVHSSLFSIATEPTNDLPHCSQLSKIAGLEVRPMIRGVRESSGTRGMVGQFLHVAILRRAGNLEVCKGGAY
jgi:hypothetical protein